MPVPDSKYEFAIDVVRRLQQAGHVAFWAGGCVRDLLQGHEPSDYDVATNAHPDTVRLLFGKRQTHAVGASFGVIIVRGPQPEENVEVATFRNEGPYLDGRRPQHVTFSTAVEDAQRRDFTINGMFFDPLTGQVHDYVGGKADIESRVIRAIGDPYERFREDKLRMLRAVRFTARFDYVLEEQTAAAIRHMAKDILVVSQERIAQELKKMLIHKRRADAMELARELDLLGFILPELVPLFPPDAAPRERRPDDAWEKTLRMLAMLPALEFELALATLLHGTLPPDPPSGLVAAFEAGISADAPPDDGQSTVEALCRRLRLSNKERDHVLWLLNNRHALRHAPHLPLSQLKRLMSHPLIADLLSLNRVDMLARQVDLAPIEFCENYLRVTPHNEIDPPALLTGDDLIRLGLHPGAEFKRILEALRDAQLEGTIRTRDDAVKLVDRLGAGDGWRDP